MIMKFTQIFTILIFFTVNSITGQYKFEKERRVKPHEVPSEAIDFVSKVKFKKKIKWYLEESQDGKTFEAKVYFKKRKHSIEFNHLGSVLDVEIETKFSKIEKETQNKINSTLEKRFRKFKIRKIQLQYKGKEEDLMNCIKKECSLKPNYEIVLKGKTDSSYKLYELLVDYAGERILKELKFSQDNFDNLQF